MKKKYQPEILRFIDEIFFPLSYEKFEKFAIIYKKEIDLPFLAFGRIGFLTEKRIKLFKDMGCLSLSIGIESGNEKLRKTILNRHMTNKEIISAFLTCNKYKLRTTAFNLLALPEEGKQEIFDTININKMAYPGLSIVTLVYPFIGTPIRDYCLKKGYISEADPIVDYTCDTIIKNDKISKKEQLILFKTFVLYILTPKYFWPFVKLCSFNNFIVSLREKNS